MKVTHKHKKFKKAERPNEGTWEEFDIKSFFHKSDQQVIDYLLCVTLLVTYTADISLMASMLESNKHWNEGIRAGNDRGHAHNLQK